MEGSIMDGSILSVQELDLDPSLHQAADLQSMSHHLQGLAPLSTTQHLSINQETDPQSGFDLKGIPKTPFLCNKGKSSGTSDEDERSLTEEGDCPLGGKGKMPSSPWQRVKWTNAMVKLLIHVVMLVGGDDGLNYDANVTDSKKKSGILQKKGKWKSVSRAMNEKGCYVSPQQCEDKFNDLNKRYKRLNDILGRGIACCVVEDPSLLETMNTLSAKAKDDVRKILSSKQLFYREICAYHSGCASLMPDAELGFQASVHAAGNASKDKDFIDSVGHQNDVECQNAGEEDEEEEEGDDDEDDDANEAEEEGYEDRDMINGRGSTPPLARHRKPVRDLDGNPSPLSSYTQVFASESSAMNQMLGIHVGTKADQQQLSSLFAAHSSTIQLEEQKVRLLAETLELQKREFKWERISSKRSRELERQRLHNQRMKLENERMALWLKHKELDAKCKRAESLMNPVDMVIERLHSKEPIKYNHNQGQSMP